MERPRLDAVSQTRSKARPARRKSASDIPWRTIAPIAEEAAYPCELCLGIIFESPKIFRKRTSTQWRRTYPKIFWRGTGNSIVRIYKPGADCSSLADHRIML